MTSEGPRIRELARRDMDRLIELFRGVFPLGIAREYGGKRAIPHVPKDNLPAKRLDESAGFRTFERVVRFVREPPEGEEALLPTGYTPSEMDLFDRRALGWARKTGGPRLLTRADERNTPLVSACGRLGSVTPWKRFEKQPSCGSHPAILKGGFPKIVWIGSAG